MEFKIVDNKKIKTAYEEFCSEGKLSIDELGINHHLIRNFFEEHFDSLRAINKDTYKFDLELGLLFFDYMNKLDGFNDYYASNADFWKTVAVYDIPDFIAKRFGKEASDHFYKKNTRIYPYVLYWYINLSWQGDIDSTRKVLENNTTDEILQLVERTSKIGINLDFYRDLMREYQNPTYDELKKKIAESSRAKKKNLTLFRLVMMRHTEKIMVLRPEFYPGGIHEYVRMLFDIREAI